MKKIALVFLVALTALSCSTSKITSSQWVSDDFNSQNLNRLLIIANTEDDELQKEFENSTAAILSKKGISPLKMHEIFPLVKYKKELTNKEIDKFVLECKEKNIDRILFASRKSTSVDTVRAKSLHNYMNSLEPLKLGSNRDDNLEYDTKEIMTYVIEAAVYDIGTKTQDEPIATTTLTANNPKSVDAIKKHFLKAVVKLFDTN